MTQFLLYSGIGFFGLVHAVQTQQQFGLHYNLSTRNLNMEDCTQVSIVSDATYCIRGPICSGNGPFPMGHKCPRRGNIATAHCSKSAKSYRSTDGECIAPVDSLCKRAKSGVWSCVWEDGDLAGPSRRSELPPKHKRKTKIIYDKPQYNRGRVAPSMRLVVAPSTPLRPLDERALFDTPTMIIDPITRQPIGSRRPPPSDRFLLQEETPQHDPQDPTTAPKPQEPKQEEEAEKVSLYKLVQDIFLVIAFVFCALCIIYVLFAVFNWSKEGANSSGNLMQEGKWTSKMYSEPSVKAP